MACFTHNLHPPHLQMQNPSHHTRCSCSAHTVPPPVDVSRRAASRLKKQGIEPTPKILYHLKKKEVWKARRRDRKEKEKMERVTDPVWYEWSEKDGVAEKDKMIAIQIEEDCLDEFLCFLREQKPEKRVVLNCCDDDVAVGECMKKRGFKVKECNDVKEKGVADKGEMECRSYRNDQTFASNYLYDSVEIEVSNKSDHFDLESDVKVKKSKDVKEKFGIKTELQDAFCSDNGRKPDLNHSYNRVANEFRDIETLVESDFTPNLASDGRITSSSIVEHNPIHINECKRVKCKENVDLNSSSDKINTGLGNVEHNPFFIHDNKRAHCEEKVNYNLNLDSHGAIISTSRKVEHNSIHMHQTKRDHQSSGEEFSHHTMANSPPHLDDCKSTDNIFPLTSDSSVDINAMLTPSRVISSKGSIKIPNETSMFQGSKEVNVEKFLDDEITQVPKMPEVWKKGVGIVQFKKPPFSKEVKERIIARRRGDWSIFSESAEEDEEEMDVEDASMFHFDGRAALLEDKRIQKLAERLNKINYWTSKVHFSKLMHSGKMKLTEDRVLRIVEILGEWGNWRRAMQVVQWVHKRQHYQFHKSKFVLTTLLSILGKAQRPVEAINVFSVMRENYSSYPDMPAYRAIAVILGQAGYLKELLELIESLKMGPPKPIKFIPVLNWESYLQPDIVVYNAVLNACIPNKEWTGVAWTWDQIEMQGIKPNGATFGLTIEAMVKAGNFDQAIRYYKRMERAGFPANAQTYKCLVETFGKAKKPDEAIALVEAMETSGTVGTAGVYFALACSLCIVGRLKEALFQVKKMQNFPSRKPDVITFTGLIQTCGEVGRIEDATFLFEHMQHTCAPNVRTCNEMIKIYGRNRMFEEAKIIYENVKKGYLEACIFFDKANRLRCDSFTFELMLKAAAISEQWAYFHCVYKDMTSEGLFLSGKTSMWVMIKVAKLKQIHLVDDMMHRLQKAGEVPHQCLYEAQILACLQSQRFQRVSGYLDDMVKNEHEVASTIEAVRKQVRTEVWDNFLKQAGSWGIVLSP